MPLFFFHLRTPEGREDDEDGLDQPDLECAYLDACRAVPTLTAGFMEEGRNPLAYAFEITDAAGTVLMEVPFDERLRRRPRPKRADPLAPIDTCAEVQLGRKLVAEMRAHVAEMSTEAARMRAAVHASRLLLACSRGRPEA